MKTLSYIRNKNRIQNLATFEIIDYGSINKAKRASRQLQGLTPGQGELLVGTFQKKPSTDQEVAPT